MLILFLLIAVVLGGSYYAYRSAFYIDRKNLGTPPLNFNEQYDPYRPRMRQIRDTFTAIPYESVSINSFDGLKLMGRYYHVADGAPLDICVHGYKSSPVIDFSGGSEMGFAMGHNMLMLEHRGHCGSEGHVITFGILERYDVASWVDYAVERFGPETKIMLYGVSMGGATVLMASDLSSDLGDPGIMYINDFSGNLVIQRNDYLNNTERTSFNITSYYNSNLSDVNLGYGNGWRFNYCDFIKNFTSVVGTDSFDYYTHIASYSTNGK